MRIAVVGPAGSGKSTFIDFLRTQLHGQLHSHHFIKCDEVVRRLYQDPNEEVTRYVLKVCPAARLSPTVYVPGQQVDVRALGSFLLSHPKERHRLENMLLERLQETLERPDTIVDGIMPRFLKKLHFDVVLYVCTPERERTRRLRQRGVSRARIAEIRKVQKALFRDPF